MGGQIADALAVARAKNLPGTCFFSRQSRIAETPFRH